MNKLLLLIFFGFIFFSYFFLVEYKRDNNKVVLIPAYFYPDGDNIKYWEDIISYKKSGHNVIVVVNQDSGDFEREDINYKKIITKLQDTDISIQGYVSTKWGQRDISLIRKNIDSWKSIYSIDSIFLDEASPKEEHYSYYADISTYISGDTTYNFGTIPDSIYNKLAGIKVLFEDSVDNLYLWNRNHSFDKSETAIIVHSVKDDKWKAWFKNNKSSFRYYYFTEDTMDNPYDILSELLDPPNK